MIILHEKQLICAIFDENNIIRSKILNYTFRKKVIKKIFRSYFRQI